MVVGADHIENVERGQNVVLGHLNFLVTGACRRRSVASALSYSLGGHGRFRVWTTSPHVLGLMVLVAPRLSGAAALAKALPPEIVPACSWSGCPYLSSIAGTIRTVVATGAIADEHAMVNGSRPTAHPDHGADEHIISGSYLEASGRALGRNTRVHFLPRAAQGAWIQRPTGFDALNQRPLIAL